MEHPQKLIYPKSYLKIISAPPPPSAIQKKPPSFNHFKWPGAIISIFVSQYGSKGTLAMTFSIKYSVIQLFSRFKPQMSLWSERVKDNLGEKIRTRRIHFVSNYNQNSYNVASLLITSLLCIKPLIYISDYIFHETVRSIRAERTEIMREKYFNKTCWVCITSVSERKVSSVAMDHLFCL